MKNKSTDSYKIPVTKYEYEYKIKFKKLHEDAVIPTYSKPFDSGMDLRSIESVVIKYGEITPVRTGLAVELPDPEETYPYTLEMQIRPRSGLAAKYGITVVNTPGTIDCISKDVKIDLLDGRSITIEELINEYNYNKNMWTYSINNNNNIVPGKINNPRIVGKRKIIGIKFKSGKYLKCTPEQLIRLREGSYKKALDLKNGDSVASLYLSKWNDGYLYYKSLDRENCGKWLPVHRNDNVEYIEELGYENVYDLTIDKYHNFSANGIFIHNCGYRGELIILLTILKNDSYQIKSGDKIAQVVIVPILSSNVIKIEEVKELNETERGTGGFGSTGK